MRNMWTNFASVLLFLSILSVIIADELSESPARKSFERAKQTKKLARITSSWADEALEKMWTERDAMAVTNTITLKYDGVPSSSIVFKDETSQPSGCHHYRTMWNVFVWAIQEGHITQDTALFDGSYGGNSALAFVHYAKLLGLKVTIFVPINMAAGKLRTLLEQKVHIVRAHISLLADVDYPVRSGHTDRSLNIFDETLDQLKENGTDGIDYYVTTVCSGALISSISRAVTDRGEATKVVAVDSQFSVYYDWIANKRFTNESGMLVWRNPGIPELGFGPQAAPEFGNTTSFDASQVDAILKIPDMATVAAMWVLRDRDVVGGPATAAGFLAAMQIAASHSPSDGKTTTIVAILSENGELYEDTYYDKIWILKNFARHGGLWGFDCWRKSIEESLSTGWDPLNAGIDTGCPNWWT